MRRFVFIYSLLRWTFVISDDELAKIVI